jgi:hypothetical protein
MAWHEDAIIFFSTMLKAIALGVLGGMVFY